MHFHSRRLHNSRRRRGRLKTRTWLDFLSLSFECMVKFLTPLNKLRRVLSAYPYPQVKKSCFILSCEHMPKHTGLTYSLVQKTCKAGFPNPRVVNNFTFNYGKDGVEKSKCYFIQQPQRLYMFFFIMLDAHTALILPCLVSYAGGKGYYYTCCKTRLPDDLPQTAYVIDERGELVPSLDCRVDWVIVFPKLSFVPCLSLSFDS